MHGADAWYERPIAEFLPDGLTCPSCGGTEFERERDILDVWFDSGSSHEAVLPFRPELTWPADLYLEGSDQHRGWFQSSLLVGLGTRGRAPFNQVVTHGFVVDEDGKKMSKSLGNTILPQDIIKQSGAEIVRLWVAMVDYREEVRLGKQIIARVVEAYRKIRNTLRYLASNLYDFDPVDRVPLDRMEEVDRYALARYAAAAGTVVDAYGRYDYPTIFQAINQFTTVDLSAFYADVSKDRLYTFAAASPERRSAQTAMYTIADGLVRLLAPILPVTTDELWRHLPGTREKSVHIAEFPKAADLAAWRDEALEHRWAILLEARSAVNAKLEALREKKVIGSSLQASVDHRCRRRACGGASEALRRHTANAVHRVQRDARTEARASAEGALTQAPGDGSAPAVDYRCCTRARREVPAMLAGRPGRVVRGRQPWAVRALRGRDDRRRGRRMIPDGRPQTGSRVSPQASDVPSTDQVLAAANAFSAPPPAAEATEPRPYAKPIELIIIAAVVIVDQLTKEIVRRTLPLHGEPAQLIPGFLDLTHVQNTGAAFGLLNAADFPYKAAVMIGIACMALDCHCGLRDAAWLS